MIGIFNLNQTLASNSAADPDDTLNTKRSLGSLGYYETPSYGMTKYPDEGLFNGIKTFQKDNNLTKDGVMKPAGETATQLGKTLAARRADTNPLRGHGANKAATDDQSATAWPSPLQKTADRPKPAPAPLASNTKPAPIKPLQRAVGRKQPNRSSDVGTAIGQLINKGIYALRNRQQDAVVKNAGLENAIETFQQANGLKVDAVMNPGGETEQALLKAPGDQHPPAAPETPSDPGQDDPDEPDGVSPKPPGDQHPPSAPDCRSLEQELEKLKTDLDDTQHDEQAKTNEIEKTEKEILEIQQEIKGLKEWSEYHGDQSKPGTVRRLPKNQILLFLSIFLKVLEPYPTNGGENAFLIAQNEAILTTLKETLASLEAELEGIEIEIVELRIAIQKAEADLKACLSDSE